MTLEVKNPNDLPTLSIKDLIPTQGDLKDLTEANYNKLKLSFEKHGFIFPISVWQDGDKNYLIDGHQRQRVITKEYGDAEVPIIKIPAKDIKEAAEILLKVTSQYGTITQEGLDTYIATYELPEAEIYEATHYDAISYLQTEEPEVEEDETPEVDEGGAALSVLGTVYQLGRHRVMCGDSTVREQVKTLMNGVRVEMCFTDPPYGVNYEGGHFHSGDVNIKRKREKLAQDDSTQIYTDVIPIIAENVDGACYTFYAGTKPTALYIAVEAIGEIHALLIWHKTNATYAAMNAQYKQRHEPFLYWKPKGSTLRWCGATTEATIWELDKDGKNDMHPTQKPISLAAKAIKNHDAKTVLDLFLGSGSTLIACEQTDRTCYGMELDPRYVDVIRKRYAKFVNNNELPDDWEELTPAIQGNNKENNGKS
jgi:DNA modification methylase